MWRAGITCLLLSVLLAATVDSRYMQVKDGRHYGLPAKIMKPMVGEPSCEDLRVMWRFSKRQSRVAEMTNEIPTYRDPFAINVWEDFPRPRDMIATVRSGGRSWNRNPIYGRVVQNAPKNHPRIANIESARAYEEVLRYFGNPSLDARRKTPVSAFRLKGGMPGPSPMSQSGSFQNLKQIIWAERAKELQQQRLLEEAVAMKNVQVPAQLARAFGKGRSSSLFLPRDTGYSQRTSSLYLPSGDTELTFPLPSYYVQGPAYRKSYRFRPGIDRDPESGSTRW